MFDSLTLIGESINDSVPSTQRFFDARDDAAIQLLALSQEAGGAAYLDVNVGMRDAAMMREICKLVQAASRLPLSVDSPDPTLARAGLLACDTARSKPILNSISLRRVEMFAIYEEVPFRPILLATENAAGGCHTAQERVDAAGNILELARKTGIPPEDCIFDLGIAPIGSDTDGNLANLMAALAMMHTDTTFTKTHRSVGLSNFTVMLPVKTRQGAPVKTPLESAFLTRAIPLGLDYIISSVKKQHKRLVDGDIALACFDDCVCLAGFDAIVRLRSFYQD